MLSSFQAASLSIAFIADANALGDDATAKLKDYLAGRPQAGVVIGILEHGQRRIIGLGRTSDAEPAVPPDGNTLYELGSITKVYTGLLLAQAVVSGQVALDTDLSALLPDVKLSEPAGTIKLEQLATHSSGLPRLPWNLFLDLITSRDDPYVHYTRQRLDDYLATSKFTPAEPGQASYSNLGAGLLGDVLARRVGISYEELVQREICQHLGLKQTVQTVSEDQRERFIRPTSLDGDVVSPWNFDSLAGAGALRSSADDQLQFLAAQLDPQSAGTLGEAIELSQQVRLDHEKSGLALFWHYRLVESDKSRVYWHNGGTGGFATFCAFHRPTRTAVVILSNCGDAVAGDHSITQLGFTLIDHLRHRNSEP